MTLLTRVRVATRELHQSLDEHPLLLRFIKDHEEDAYRGFLEAFRAFVAGEMHGALEFLKHEEDQAVFEYQSWREALEADLQAMASLPLKTPMPNVSFLVPSITSVSEYWGTLYVLEGSVLGGREIAKLIPESWPKEFLLRGGMSRQRWPYFLKRMSSLDKSGEILFDEVELGAIKAFQAMTSMFDLYEARGEENLHDDQSPSP